MKQPKFRFGDKVKDVDFSNNFIVGAIEFTNGAYFYSDSEDDSRIWHEETIELYQEPQKKKLCAWSPYSHRGLKCRDIQFKTGNEEEFATQHLERMPEYDIEYPLNQTKE